MASFFDTLFARNLDEGEQFRGGIGEGLANMVRESLGFRAAPAALERRAQFQDQRDLRTAMRSGDVGRVAGIDPTAAGARLEVDDAMASQRRAAALRAVRAAQAVAEANDGDEATAFDLIAQRAPGLFDENSRGIVEQGGLTALEALYSPGGVEGRIQSVQQAEDGSLFAITRDGKVQPLGVKGRVPIQVREVGGAQVAVTPGAGGVSVRPLSTAGEEDAAAYARKQAEASGAAFGKAGGEIAAEDLPRSDREARQAQMRVESAQQRLENASGVIDSLIDRAGLATTGFAALSAAIPGTAAANYAADLGNIEAVVGFEELQRLRAESPTGGALGPVSDTENRLLQSSIAAVRQSQGPQQLKANLARLKDQMRMSWERVAAAYEKDFGRSYTGTTEQESRVLTLDEFLSGSQ